MAKKAKKAKKAKSAVKKTAKKGFRHRHITVVSGHKHPGDKPPPRRK